MNKKKETFQILFWGSESELSESLTTELNDLRVAGDSEMITCFCSTEIEKILSPLTSTSALCIVLDLSSQDNISLESLEKIRLFRRYGLFSKIPIVGIFNDKEQSLELLSLFSLGMSFAYIKGNDFKQFIYNLAYIITENDRYIRRYAKATNFSLSTKISNLIHIDEIDSETILINTDIPIDEEDVNVELNLFHDFNVNEFQVIDSFNVGSKFFTPMSHLLKIPYDEGWDVDDDSLQIDTFESWLEMAEQLSDVPKTSVLVINKEEKLIDELFKSKAIHFSEINMNICSEFNENNKDILAFEHGVIFYQMSDEASYDSLTLLINELGYLNLNPYLVLFNHTSDASALRKAYMYEKLMAVKTALSINEVKSMIKLFNDKNDVVTNKKSFKLDSNKIIGRLGIDVEITSITENEITFTSDTEIPYYSVFEIEKPKKMFFLVVPLFGKNVQTQEYSYQGFFIGLTPDESSYLRVFTNELITKVPKKWDYLPLKDLYTDFGNEKQAKNVEEKEEDLKELTENYLPKRMKSEKMKSKL